MRIRGPMLWTHFGVSGPSPMNASRFWHRARLEGRAVDVVASLLPGSDFAAAERWLLETTRARPVLSLRGALGERLPASLAAAVLAELGLTVEAPLAQVRREDRRRLLRALLGWPLPVRDSRGYGFAEVTSGGVPLDEVNAGTMESRRCRPPPRRRDPRGGRSDRWVQLPMVVVRRLRRGAGDRDAARAGACLAMRPAQHTSRRSRRSLRRTRPSPDGGIPALVQGPAPASLLACLPPERVPTHRPTRAGGRRPILRPEENASPPGCAER